MDYVEQKARALFAADTRWWAHFSGDAAVAIPAKPPFDKLSRELSDFYLKLAEQVINRERSIPDYDAYPPWGWTPFSKDPFP